MNEQQVAQLLEQHKGISTVVFAWLVRETPLFWKWFSSTAWPWLLSIYPYVKANGGIFPIIGNFFYVRKQKAQANEKVNPLIVSNPQPSQSGNGPKP